MAATKKFVVLGDRDLQDQNDVFRCYHADSGQVAWEFSYEASGHLDYGNTPRATPLIHYDKELGEIVIVQGAFGHLHCLELSSGDVLWLKNLRDEFDVTAEYTWGFCGSPLIVDGRLIVNPGGADAAIVALDPATGEVIWESPGKPSAYGSLIAARLGGVLQIVGHDKTSLNGWDAANGKRLWQLTPENEDDFNVPTPVIFQQQLLVTSENNGSRLFRFKNDGKIHPEPIATFGDLASDISTPIAVKDRLYCVWGEMFCLDQKLKPVWVARERAFVDYAAAIGGPNSVLVVAASGDLILIDASADRFQVVSRTALFKDAAQIYAHPAIVGDRLYIRGETSISCVRLGTKR